MSTSLPEIIRWKYHTRELQATAILVEADNRLNAEIYAHAEQFRRMNAILLTPPFLLNPVIDSFHEDQEQFYTQAIDAVRILAKRDRTLEILMRLAKVCGDETIGTREVPIDFVDLTIPLPIREAFKSKERIFEQTVAEGHDEAAKGLLSLTQGEVPLIRYRRDLASMKFTLFPTIDGGWLGYIPTKLDEVDLKFWYSKAEILPRLSFRVKPFDYNRALNDNLFIITKNLKNNLHLGLKLL